MPYGVTATGSWLIVADTANSRLMGRYDSNLQTGAKAQALAGQPTFQATGDKSMELSHEGELVLALHVQVCDKFVVVSDSGNNRVQLWGIDGALLS